LGAILLQIIQVLFSCCRFPPYALDSDLAILVFVKPSVKPIAGKRKQKNMHHLLWGKDHP